MSILKLNNKEYKIYLINGRNEAFPPKTEKERMTIENILTNISLTIDLKADTETIRAIIYKKLKNTKIKFKDIRMREI